MSRTLALNIMITVAMIVVGGCSPVLTRQAAPTALAPIPDRSGVTAEGRLEPIRFAALAFNADGLVSEVLASEGDQVEAGQLIARLDSTQTQTLEEARNLAAVELGSAHETVRVAQKELDAYPLPKIFVGLTAQQATQTWLDNLDKARADFEPYRDTDRKALKPNHIFKSLPAGVWFDTGEFHGMAKEYNKHVDVAWMNYRKAVAWLTLDSALETAKAHLLQAQKNYDGLQDTSPSGSAAGTRAALANSELRAPFAGTITNLDVKLGEHVSSGRALATVADTTSWIVKTTNLTEIDVVNVAEGGSVKVSLDAVPTLVFDGRLLRIAENYSDRQGDIVYTATILLGENHPDMRWGMTAQVAFGE